MSGQEVFSMDEVAKALNSQGIKAEIMHTGGGCSTLYVGLADSEGYYSLAAGAGYFEQRTMENNKATYSEAFGYWSEFWIGVDGEEEKGGYYNGEKTIEALVAYLVEAYKTEELEGSENR
jgi:hypothetical protein